jgi:hypothetical protein
MAPKKCLLKCVVCLHCQQALLQSTFDVKQPANMTSKYAGFTTLHLLANHDCFHFIIHHEVEELRSLSSRPLLVFTYIPIAFDFT